MKRVGVIAVQLLVTGAGLWYVFHGAERRAQIADALRHARLGWILLAWICYSAVEILATVRWQILLRLQGIRLSWPRAGAIVMIGLFFNQFLPGAVGGDAMRLYLIFKQAPARKVGAALSIAMDRLLGLLAIVFLASMSFSLRFGWLRSGTSLHIAVLALVLLSVGLVFVILVFWLANRGALRQLPKRLAFRKTIIQSGEALRRYRTHRGSMAFAFVVTVVAHVAYYTTFYCAGASLAGEHTASFTDILTIMPIVNTITSVPISLGGAGVRETLFQHLLGDLAHVPPAIAAFTASLGYAIQVSWGLIGAVVFLVWQKIADR